MSKEGYPDQNEMWTKYLNEGLRYIHCIATISTHIFMHVYQTFLLTTLCICIQIIYTDNFINTYIHTKHSTDIFKHTYIHTYQTLLPVSLYIDCTYQAFYHYLYTYIYILNVHVYVPSSIAYN